MPLVKPEGPGEVGEEQAADEVGVNAHGLVVETEDVLEAC